MKTLQQKMILTSASPKNLTIMLFVCLSLCLLSAVQVTAQTCTPAIETSRTAVRARPTPPALPAAGGKFCDPTFGTKIMRVTDEVSVPVGGAGTSYSYWATFNSNNTRLLVMEVGAQQMASIYEFNPTTFTLVQRLAPVPYPPNDAPIRLDDAVWAFGDHDKLFMHTDNGRKIYSYKVSTQTYTLVADLSSHLASNEFLQQMSVAQDDDTFSFGLKTVGPDLDAQGNPIYRDSGYIVYRDSTDTVRAQSAVPVNEVRLDKTGRYLFVNTNDQGVGQIEVQIVDLNTSQVQNLTDDAPDHAPSHYDVGAGMAVGNGNYLLGISARSLSNPHSFTEILDLTNEGNYGGFHLSMLADNELWTLVSFYTDHLNDVMQDELVQVSTDGSQQVRRLAHHQSIFTGDYYQSPRANISRDGRFVAFSSNWGGRSRNDLFIVEIPPAPTAASAADVVWVEDAVPAGSSTAADNDSWNWVSSNPAPFSGTSAHQSSIYGGWHQHFFYDATSTLSVGLGDKLFTYIYLDPANTPSEIMLQWNDGTWEHRAYWGANNIPWGTDGTNSRRYMGALPAAGQWVRLEVPASQVGLEGATLNGMAFTLYGGRATWDRAGKTSDVVWVDDAIPTGGIADGLNEGWTWVSSSPTPFSGTLSHQSNIFAGWHQHYFSSATNTLTVNTGDKLFAYIYLDPANIPGEVMLQWYDGTWEHRAYWGSDIIPWGTNGTNTRRYMGALPAAGQWVRLEVPASQVGLEGATLNGMAFTLNGGRATWDRAGKSR